VGAARREVRWSTAAREDLREIVTYIAEDRTLAAESVLNKILSKVGGLATASSRGRIPPEMARFGIAAFREVVIRPWRVIYEVMPLKVEVHAVLDARRDVEDILLRRLVRR
jgi:toxin ParE1/3/4